MANIKANKTIILHNLEEEEYRQFQELEEQYPDEMMLVRTRKAFDGDKLTKIILFGLEASVKVVELILLLKKHRSAGTENVKEKRSIDVEFGKNEEKMTKVPLNDFLPEHFTGDETVSQESDSSAQQ